VTSEPTPGRPTSFGERLQQVFAERGRLCVGIDPHSWLLSHWGLPDSADGAETFGRRVVEAAAGLAGILKPQVAFYERFGSAGFAALEHVLADARAAGLLVIADVKRGDLGTSVQAYGEAWLTPGSPLEADAITLNPYMGVGSLDAPVNLAASVGKGTFLLAATSNPEGESVQAARIQSGPRAGLSVARAVLDDVAERNAQELSLSGGGPTLGPTLGSTGVVLGATLDLASFGIDIGFDASNVAAGPLPPVLAPGFGHQGASVADLDSIYGGFAGGVIVSESRSVLSAGPDRIRESIARRVSEIGAPRG
jgi:orotidine-5'-phosphate decarboxylase